MNWEDVKNLDFEDPGGWPPAAKGVAAAAVVIFILVVAYFLVTLTSVTLTKVHVLTHVVGNTKLKKAKKTTLATSLRSLTQLKHSLLKFKTSALKPLSVVVNQRMKWFCFLKRIVQKKKWLPTKMNTALTS